MSLKSKAASMYALIYFIDNAGLIIPLGSMRLTRCNRALIEHYRETRSRSPRPRSKAK